MFFTKQQTITPILIANQQFICTARMGWLCLSVLHGLQCIFSSGLCQVKVIHLHTQSCPLHTSKTKPHFASGRREHLQHPGWVRDSRGQGFIGRLCNLSDGGVEHKGFVVIWRWSVSGSVCFPAGASLSHTSVTFLFTIAPCAHFHRETPYPPSSR